MDNSGAKTDRPVRRSLAPMRAGIEPPTPDKFIEDLLMREIAYELDNLPGLSGPALDHICMLVGFDPEMLPSFWKLTDTERAAAVEEAARMLFRLYHGVIWDRIMQDNSPSRGPASPQEWNQERGGRE